MPAIIPAFLPVAELGLGGDAGLFISWVLVGVVGLLGGAVMVLRANRRFAAEWPAGSNDFTVADARSMAMSGARNDDQFAGVAA